MIYEFPNYIDDETIEYIKQQVYPTIDYTKKKTYNRTGQTVPINEDEKHPELDLKLFSIFSKIQKDIAQDLFNPQFESGDSGYEFHRYNPNETCDKHSDGEVVCGLLRYATVIIFLNTVNQGGELVFDRLNKKVKPEKGKLVLFPPYGMFEHYTLPSPETREIIMTWFVYNNVNVNFL
jgi:hypothetical protein